MSDKSYTFCSAWRIALIAASLAVSACDAVNEAIDAINDIGNDAEVHYYVSIGTSLSVGVRPNGSGALLPTDDGYADQLLGIIKPTFDTTGTPPRELRLVKFGCPGETLDSLTNGGSCPYLAGSQLDAAVDFITDNPGRIHLVTIDMGGNDFRNAGCFGATVDPACATAAAQQIYTDLTPVLTTLSNAIGPETTIIGMNYYNPYLASWLEDLAGQAYAIASAEAVAIATGYLRTAYMDAGLPMADVADAFSSDDFATMVASSQPPPNNPLPLNVNNICELTYMCDPAPRGPDIHANPAGYSLIADTFADIYAPPPP